MLDGVMRWLGIETDDDGPVSRVSPEDYPKDDGGRPDYGSPNRMDNAQDPSAS